MKESYLWSQVKENLESEDCHLCRIENTAGTGISDVNGCRAGQEVWIELKMFVGNLLKFRTSQRIWISRRVKVGGRALILARKESKLLLYDALAVVQSKSLAGGDGKSFSVHVRDLPPPLFETVKPFRWSELKNRIFETPDQIQTS